MIRRRTVVTALAASVFARPLAVRAQTARRRVGVIHAGGPYVVVLEGFLDGLKQLGFEEPRNLALYVRETKVTPKAVEETTRGLIREKVEVIFAIGSTVARPMKPIAEGAALPVVFAVGTDPVSLGMVRSFASPGGRFTGIHYLTTDLTAKRVELLKGMLPKLRRAVIFYNPDNPTPRESVTAARQMARQLQFELLERHVKSTEDLRASLAILKAGDADAFFYVPDATVGSQAQLVIDAANGIGLPTMFHERTMVVQGALAGYGVNYHEIGRLSAKFAQRVLAGAAPKDLPVENIDRLEFVLNLRTARELGLTIPQLILIRADQVIQ